MLLTITSPPVLRAPAQPLIAHSSGTLGCHRVERSTRSSAAKASGKSEIGWWAEQISMSPSSPFTVGSCKRAGSPPLAIGGHW